jgi:hypothetical protein
MNPTVWTKAFIEIKVVLSAMVVALDMYMMHKVTEPEKMMTLYEKFLETKRMS